MTSNQLPSNGQVSFETKHKMSREAVDLSHQLSNSLSLSTSPDQVFSSRSLTNGHSLSPQNSRDPRVRRYTATGVTRELTPFNTEDIKILLLENVNQSGIDILKEQGYQVETLKGSLSEDDLIAKIRYSCVPLLSPSNV